MSAPIIIYHEFDDEVESKDLNFVCHQENQLVIMAYSRLTRISVGCLKNAPLIEARVDILDGNMVQKIDHELDEDAESRDSGGMAPPEPMDNLSFAWKCHC